MLDSLKIILVQDFSHSPYLQPNGLAMGNPLGPLLADLFLDHLEINEIFIENTVGKNIHWYNYVDDIFAIMNFNLR